MGTIKAAIWTLLSGEFVHMYMTQHYIKANWLAVIWIILFALQMTLDMTRKEKK